MGAAVVAEVKIAVAKKTSMIRHYNFPLTFILMVIDLRMLI